jgi:hypothetical protein
VYHENEKFRLTYNHLQKLLTLNKIIKQNPELDIHIEKSETTSSLYLYIKSQYKMRVIRISDHEGKGRKIKSVIIGKTTKNKTVLNAVRKSIKSIYIANTKEKIRLL